MRRAIVYYSYLGAAVVSGRLADVEQPGALPDQIEHVVGDEAVVEHQVRRLDGPHRLEREQLRVTGPRPHQRHPPGPAAAALPFRPPPSRRPQRLQQPPQLRQLQRDLVVPATRRSRRRSRSSGRRRRIAIRGGVGPGVAAVPRGGCGLGEGRSSSGADDGVSGGGGPCGESGGGGGWRGNGGGERLEARWSKGERHGDAGIVVVSWWPWHFYTAREQQEGGGGGELKPSGVARRRRGVRFWMREGVEGKGGGRAPGPGGRRLDWKVAATLWSAEGPGSMNRCGTGRGFSVVLFGGEGGSESQVGVRLSAAGRAVRGCRRAWGRVRSFADGIVMACVTRSRAPIRISEMRIAISQQWRWLRSRGFAADNPREALVKLELLSGQVLNVIYSTSVSYFKIL